ncbi:hypothetical protein KV134_10260 [Tetragenococcus halophilus]|uniref:hypothetical protein n=1 Tax=Tetragenococcus halophilus TaxID=51669 RepID=UPI000CB3740B|nr:hypothetical protein [Tetragenococcus halophilus]NRR74905.1 hypothetical protein [Tetragenococcus halophilus]NWO00322.1 hypothetical protein [Tetragenococcus halophilus]QXN86538.1 hypothetical protein KV134_10260 [Tetragenococcus halophilus]RQD29458.1 hypothetical protein C7K42_11370 [Tetragenococcus halophilus subsp. halophilus DSM 20339]WJS81591.1 hypothetical protein KFZ55_10055 [Tetragenococcus halophilus]
MQLDQEQIRKIGQKQIVETIRLRLPYAVTLFAYNISKTDMSVYSLLHQNTAEAGNLWMTLRVADHPLWLKNAQQVSIDIGSPADLTRLPTTISKVLSCDMKTKNCYQMTNSELAVLELLDSCQRNGLVWAVRLPEEIFTAFKKRPLDLQKDFMQAEVFLTNRNNVNALLLPFTIPCFQAQLAKLYGRNLLFSQFSRHHLLKLLPTNQWIQPMLEKEQKLLDWRQQIIYDYGEDFYQRCQQALQI